MIGNSKEIGSPLLFGGEGRFAVLECLVFLWLLFVLLLEIGPRGLVRVVSFFLVRLRCRFHILFGIFLVVRGILRLSCRVVLLFRLVLGLRGLLASGELSF